MGGADPGNQTNAAHSSYVMSLPSPAAAFYAVFGCVGGSAAGSIICACEGVPLVSVTGLSLLTRIIEGLMADGDVPAAGIVRLKEDSVLCQYSGCEKAAEFLLRRAGQAVALCTEHLKALGFREEELPGL